MARERLRPFRLPFRLLAASVDLEDRTSFKSSTPPLDSVALYQVSGSREVGTDYKKGRDIGPEVPGAPALGGYPLS